MGVRLQRGFGGVSEGGRLGLSMVEGSGRVGRIHPDLSGRAFEWHNAGGGRNQRAPGWLELWS